MNEKKRPFLLQEVSKMQQGYIAAWIGFLLYLGASALSWDAAAIVIGIAFGILSLYVFCSVAALRRRDKTLVGYNLLWGMGALTILLLGGAVLEMRQRLGL